VVVPIVCPRGPRRLGQSRPELAEPGPDWVKAYAPSLVTVCFLTWGLLFFFSLGQWHAAHFGGRQGGLINQICQMLSFCWKLNLSYCQLILLKKN